MSTGVKPVATDCLFILNAAVGLQTCTFACTCDINGSGGNPNATDALICLNAAVGVTGVLNCTQPCPPTGVAPPKNACSEGEFIAAAGSDLDAGWNGAGHNASIVEGASIFIEVLRRCGGDGDRLPRRRGLHAARPAISPATATAPTRSARSPARSATSTASSAMNQTCEHDRRLSGRSDLREVLRPAAPALGRRHSDLHHHLLPGGHQRHRRHGHRRPARLRPSCARACTSASKPPSPARAADRWPRTPRWATAFTCDGGPRNGQACTVGAISPDFGGTSFDCPPDSTSNVSGVGLAINFASISTGTRTRDADPALRRQLGGAAPEQRRRGLPRHVRSLLDQRRLPALHGRADHGVREQRRLHGQRQLCRGSRRSRSLAACTATAASVTAIRIAPCAARLGLRYRRDLRARHGRDPAAAGQQVHRSHLRPRRRGAVLQRRHAGLREPDRQGRRVHAGAYLQLQQQRGLLVAERGHLHANRTGPASRTEISRTGEPSPLGSYCIDDPAVTTCTSNADCAVGNCVPETLGADHGGAVLHPADGVGLDQRRRRHPGTGSDLVQERDLDAIAAATQSSRASRSATTATTRTATAATRSVVPSSHRSARDAVCRRMEPALRCDAKARPPRGGRAVSLRRQRCAQKPALLEWPHWRSRTCVSSRSVSRSLLSPSEAFPPVAAVLPRRRSR